MAIYDDIRKVFEVTLSQASGLPSDIFYENVQYNPSTGTSHLRTLLIPTSRRPAVRGLNPQQRYQGIFRVIVYCAENEGPATADAFADTIMDTFDATDDLTYNSVTVSLEYSERTQGIPNSPWYAITVDIAWYIYT